MKWLVLVLLLQSGLAVADIPPGPPPSAKGPDRADKEGFEPVTDRDLDKARVDESVSGPNLIAAAYGFILAALVLYAWSIGRRAQRVEGELNNLHARIAKRLEDAGKASKAG